MNDVHELLIKIQYMFSYFFNNSNKSIFRYCIRNLAESSKGHLKIFLKCVICTCSFLTVIFESLMLIEMLNLRS